MTQNIMPTADPEVWPQERLADEVAFAISVAGRLRREDREIAFALEITRLRAGIQAMLDGDYPCPGTYARNHTMCPHNVDWPESCWQCDEAWLVKVLKGDAP